VQPLVAVDAGILSPDEVRTEEGWNPGAPQRAGGGGVSRRAKKVRVSCAPRHRVKAGTAPRKLKATTSKPKAKQGAYGRPFSFC
jgi:hypothetical protein